jgi:phosphoribosylanthranilate isomerase
VKVKICGLCRPEDAQTAQRLGADYVGTILSPGSRRSVVADAALRVYEGANNCLRVGVFQDPTLEEIKELLNTLQLNVLQLHGAETPAFVAEVAHETGCEIWKALWLRSPGDLHQAIDKYAGIVDGLLLDSATGGSGEGFEWSLAGQARELIPDNVELIVAGGLRPDNVKSAVEQMKPDIVDVASGVESVVGEKSPEKIEAFIRNAKG